MLADIVEFLVCPVCGDRMALGERVLRCPAGHAFDVARQGYVSLLTGSQAPGTADSPAMVAARDAFLGAGHFDPLADAVADACRTAVAARTTGPGDAETGSAEAGADAGPVVADAGPGTTGADAGAGPVVADAGAGTGYYLARVLDRLPGAVGIALDVSKHAVRRAARAHPRLGAVVADVWRPLPVASGAVDVLLNVFAPRNGSEFARILRPGGVLVVVTPTVRHLEPLVDRLGLLSVDESKERRTAESLGGRFTATGRSVHEFSMRLRRADVEAVVGMGPSAWHVDTEVLQRQITELPDTSTVTASFHISTFKSHP
ncbi:rRNA (guanine-N1)-methyltransferase [Planomonospora parontospora subsp. parontospora]|uniref:rRNA (Guanine-N1)-methyltransferase n=2 Tax=Planomonospora parontospora TaxID=58119 RepID=A0AA37F6A5_9ACTN|nr:methyltransferase domain-containing protein [Planomonospora parontospora]GGK80728.1 rRNA (guanine-N1)-methyltransferase [Planomonospora parontospora]GII11369.1 rRNA (guanine-N1)-methyltransferase [Planomonospora parontospora subsp. parontospora]